MTSTAHTAGSLAAYLASRPGAHAPELAGPPHIPVTRIDTLDRAAPGSITFIRTQPFADRWADSHASCALVTRGLNVPRHDPALRALIVVADADLALSEILDLFAPRPERPATGVHPAACVDPSAAVAPTASVGPHCVVGPNARIGDGTVLGAGCFLGRDVTVGRACTLHPRVVVLDRCSVGDGCIIHPGAVIGADGFGYRPSPDGRGVVKIPHIGNVEIGPGVEIGANACIDRAKFGSTTIGAGCKIDNLVHIGHNCTIGRACLIAAQAGLSGSCTLGDGVQLGGQTGLADNIEISSGVKLAGQSGAIGDIDTPGAYIGTPPIPLRDFFKMHATLRRLTRDRTPSPESARGARP